MKASPIAPAVSLALAFALAFAGCATPAKPRKVTVSELIQFDRTIGGELARQLDPKLGFERDPAVQAYLDQVAQRLADKTPELHIPEARVFLLRDNGGKWASYGLPGGRLYLSVGILRELRFENEVAALIAIELGHLLKQDVLSYLRGLSPDGKTRPSPVPGEGLPSLQAPERLDFFGQDGVFGFSDERQGQAAEAAVDILYAAGYDPRGIMTLFKHFEDNPLTAPYGPALLSALVERARQRVDLQGPLLNPIVRTDRFEAMQSRLKGL